MQLHKTVFYCFRDILTHKTLSRRGKIMGKHLSAPERLCVHFGFFDCRAPCLPGIA